MSSNDKNMEDQLLQDASTLLMFANVAAKQQHEGHKSPSPPSGPASGPASSHASSSALHTLERTSSKSPHSQHSPSSRPHPQQHLYSFPHQQVSQMGIPQHSPHLLQSKLQTQQAQHQRVVSHDHAPPHNASLPKAPSIGNLIDQPSKDRSNHPIYPHHRAHHSFDPARSHEVFRTTEKVSPPPVQSHSLPESTSHSKNSSISLPDSNNPPSANMLLPSLAKSYPHQQSLPQQPTRGHQSVSPPSTVPPDSKKATNLPAQGNFLQNAHKRSASSPSVTMNSEHNSSPSPSLYNITNPPTHNSVHHAPNHHPHPHHILSPGPANVALARGINMESGKRNNSNAMIAAAALAAAADIPLPLIKKDQQDFDKAGSSTTKELRIKSESPASFPAENSDKQNAEDAVATEDEDINQTDDEQQQQPPPPPKLQKVNPVENEQKKGDADSKPFDIVKPTPASNERSRSASLKDIMNPEGDSTDAMEDDSRPTEKTPGTKVSHQEEENAQKDDLHSIPARSPSPQSIKAESQPKPESEVKNEEANIADKQPQDEKHNHPPPLAKFQVDPDSGLIGCICGIDDDDGFTIQCDVCFRWQHCLCMGFNTNEEVPEDEYKCYYCDKSKWGKFDPETCRNNTLERLDTERSNGAPDTYELASQREPQPHSQHSPKSPLKRKLSSTGSEDQKRKKSDKSVHKSPINNDIQMNSGDNITPTARNSIGSKEQELDKKSSPTSRSAHFDSQANSIVPDEKSPKVSSPPKQSPKPTDVLPNKDNELLDDGVSAESYQSVYYKLRKNDYKRPAIKTLFEELGSRYFESYSKSTEPPIEIMSLTQFKNIKVSRIILPNHQRYLQERNEFKRNKGHNKSMIQVRSYGDNPKQKFNGITRLGLFISERIPNGQDHVTIPENTPVIEYLGEIDFFSNYRNDHVNQYSTWGTSKPRVLKTSLKFSSAEEPLDVVLDSRFVGNESRFIRKACPNTVNCVVKPVYIPQSNSFRYMVYTTKPITLNSSNSDEELRFDWGWDEKHPILKMYQQVNKDSHSVVEGLKFDHFSDEEKTLLIAGIDNILHFIECGCTTSSSSQQCAIYKIKKATSYLLRSTRKASNISNVNLAKSREELIRPKRSKDFVSWNERLVERDREIQVGLAKANEETSTTKDEPMTDANDKSTFEIGQDEKGSQKSTGDNQPGGVANDEDKETDEGNEADDRLRKKLSFSVPFKQQLIARGRRVFSQLDKHIGKDVYTNARVEASSLDTSTGLMVPIVPEVVFQIKKSVEEEIKPIPLESSHQNFEVKQAAEQQGGDKNAVTLPIPLSKNEPATIDDATDTNSVKNITSTEGNDQSAEQAEGDAVSNQASSVLTAPTHKPESGSNSAASSSPPAPQIVKKLSFADYKKKMK